jgi:acetyl-CoA carboxylase biotin carboxyl carrier protein
VAVPVPVAPAPAAAPAPAPPAAPKRADNVVEIKSPLVGTFYRSPKPDADAFVNVGDEVQPEKVLCIIEAMKVMNEIKAETAGIVREVLVKNGQAVEFGEVLFVLEKK